MTRSDLQNDHAGQANVASDESSIGRPPQYPTDFSQPLRGVGKSASRLLISDANLGTFTSLTGSIAGGIALIVLAGWVLNLEVLKSVLSGLATMKANTAFCVLISAVALWLRSQNRPIHPATSIMAIPVALIGLATLAEYWTGIDFHIDELIFRDSKTDPSMFPGRMASMTAANFVLTGASLVLLDLQSVPKSIPQTLVLAVIFNNLLAMIGYLYGPDVLYQVGPFSSVSALTVTSFLLLSIGILSAWPELGVMPLIMSDSLAGTVVRRQFVTAFILLMTIGWLRLAGQRSGLFPPEFGTAFIIAFSIFCFAVMLGVTGHLIYFIDHQRQEAALIVVEQRELLHATLVSIGDGVIVTDEAARITLLNKEAERLTGWTQHAAIGKSLEEIFRIVNETTRISVENPALRALHEGRIVGLANHTILLSKDGRESPIDDSAAPIYRSDGKINGAVLVFRDITARKTVEQSAQLAKDRLEFALDAAKLGQWSLDIRSGQMTCSETCKANFGRQPYEDFDYKELLLAIDGRDSERVQQSIKQAIETHTEYVSEYRIRRPDGSKHWIFARGQVSYAIDGSPLDMTGVTMDITDRKQMEHDLRQFAASLSAADRRKDEFLATLAHELRNPLAPIRNGLQLIKLLKDNDDAVEQARSMMERQLTQVVRLVDDLMDVSRINSGKLDLRKEPLELSAIIASGIETARPLIEQMAHELTVELPQYPVVIHGDMTRLSQIMMNLITNAAKYTNERGRIQIVAVVEGMDVVVKVRDFGIGIPKDKLRAIFEMFSQVDRSLEKSQGGLGIGLALVKRLVEMHGGSIEAKSDGPGMGSEFVLRLPMSGAESDNAVPEQDEDRLTSSSLRLLIVDDNQDAANSLAIMLRLLGNDIRTAFDGQEAIDVAEAFRPHVVLLDIGLPKLNGYEVCRSIRNRPWGNTVVVIALTGWGQDEDRRRSQEAGFDQHLTKPMDPVEISKMLSRVRLK